MKTAISLLYFITLIKYNKPETIYSSLNNTPLHSANFQPKPRLIHTDTSTMLAQSILSFALLVCGTLAAPTPGTSYTAYDLEKRANWQEGKCEASIRVDSTPPKQFPSTPSFKPSPVPSTKSPNETTTTVPKTAWEWASSTSAGLLDSSQRPGPSSSAMIRSQSFLFPLASQFCSLCDWLVDVCQLWSTQHLGFAFGVESHESVAQS